MAQFGQVRPELGRQDWSAVARGGEAYGAGVGQGLASLGASVGKAMDQRKQMKAEVKAAKDLLNNPVMQNFASEMGVTPEMLQDLQTRFDDGSLREQYAGAQQLNQMFGGIMQAGIQMKARGSMPPSDDRPSAVREYEYFSGLDKDDQETFLDVKRGSPGAKIVETAEGKFVFDPETREMIPLTTGEEETTAKAREVAATTRASEETKIDIERTEAQAAKDEALRQTLQDVEIMTSKIDDAIEATGDWTTGGVGYALSYLPGTPAYELRRDSIATIKNKLSAKALSDMRASSPSGGAVGQVTEKEWERLGTLVASLDVGLSEETLDKNLNEIKTIYDKWGEAMQTAHAKDLARETAQPEIPSFATEEEAESAGLQDGQQVMINGQLFTYSKE